MFQSYFTALGAISQIYIVIAVAYMMRKRNMVSSEGISTIAKLSTYLFLPSLIFSKNIRGFDPDQYSWWWMITLWSIVILLVGIGITYLFFIQKGKSFKNRLPMGAMQNSGYYILPIGMVLFPDQFDTFSSFVFLAVLGVSPTIWTFGRSLISPASKFSIKKIITPPFIANVTSVTIVLLGGREYVPEVMLTPLELFGSAAIVTGLFVLGSSLAEIKIDQLPPVINIIKVNLVKFIILPIITIAVIKLTGIINDPILRVVLILEACSPPAVALMLIARTYKGDVPLIGSYIFIGYIGGLIFVPIWIVISGLIF